MIYKNYQFLRNITVGSAVDSKFCPSNCLTCIGNSEGSDENGLPYQSGECKKCIQKYFLYDKKCYPCSDDELCLECSSSKYCDKCIDGAKRGLLSFYKCFKNWKNHKLSIKYYKLKQYIKKTFFS